MHTPRALRSALVGLAASVAAAVVLPASPASAAPNLVPVTGRAAIDGNGGQLGNGSYDPVLSATGRYLAFSDVGTENAWVQDLWTGRATQVSVTPAGTPANDNVTPVGVSADGNRVAFVTGATNLAGGAHTASDLYVRDRKANTTTRVNIGTGGSLTEVYDENAGMGDAGTTVSWTATNGHVYFRTITPGTTQQVDVSTSEVSGNDSSLTSRMTADGMHVVFSSYASNLVAGDTNPKNDVFVRNILSGTTIKASYAQGGAQPDAGMSSPSASADGRYVVWTSSSNALSASDKNPGDDVFLRDTVANTTTVVSLVGASGAIDNHAAYPVISADGKHVLFTSRATNIAAGDKPGTLNVFRRDLATQSTAPVDRSTGLNLGNGAANGSGALSSDGSVAAYVSGSTNLVQDDTNGRDDVFVRLPVSMGSHNALSQFATTVRQRFTGSTAGAGTDTVALTNGRVVPARLVSDLAHAPTFAQHREPITRLYFAFFDRQPDRSGLDYWVAKRKAGTNLNTIATKFAQSSEFKTKYGSVGAEQFVTLVYQNVLDRNPDQAGLDHWVGKMQGGMTRGQVMVQFSESSEGKRHLAPQLDTSLIGLGLLGTMAAKADFASALAAWKAAGVPEGAARWFIDSPAYAASIA